jgi:hypothetical protein
VSEEYRRGSGTVGDEKSRQGRKRIGGEKVYAGSKAGKLDPGAARVKIDQRRPFMRKAAKGAEVLMIPRFRGVAPVGLRKLQPILRAKLEGALAACGRRTVIRQRRKSGVDEDGEHEKKTKEPMALSNRRIATAPQSRGVSARDSGKEAYRR